MLLCEQTELDSSVPLKISCVLGKKKKIKGLSYGLSENAYVAKWLCFLN